ncbi:MAG: tetratricopeptide repeat protein [Opitutaceae bacterium]
MPSPEILENLAAYLPIDRVDALCNGTEFSEFSDGAALFADISGFTPLTEAVVSRYGPRRGGEELTNHLNRVYDALIRQVDAFGGSVIGFAGDAITCWFGGDDGRRALASAFGMQAAMDAFKAITLPDGAQHALAMKVAVATGRVRRFVVGDPAIQLFDLIAGRVLESLADAEHGAERGDVVCDDRTVASLGGLLSIRERRPSEMGQPIAVVDRLIDPPIPSSRTDRDRGRLGVETLRPWLIQEVFQRIVSAQGEFLTELRPAASVFVRFTGIQFEADPAAPEKLDAYVRWMQAIIERLGGTLVQLTIGDKGSFAYFAFGAPTAHEDDTARALMAALEVRDSPPHLREIVGDVQVGVTRGTMRTGAYGGLSRRTYGVLGDDVNLSARLMQNARPGQILVSESAARRHLESFFLPELPRIRVKGKSEPIQIFELQKRREQTTAAFKTARYRLPMIGRKDEMAAIQGKLEAAAGGRGQLISIEADAGVGKSRLIAEVVQLADRMNFLGYAGECQAFARTGTFSVWWSIWREFFGIRSDLEARAIPGHLAAQLESIEPGLGERAPLLGPILNLELPDSELTRTFDAKLRRSSLISLLITCIRCRAAAQPLVIVLEDAHWIDAASREVLIALAQAAVRIPLALFVVHRPGADGTILTADEETLDYHTRIELGDFSEDEARQLVELRLDNRKSGDRRLERSTELIELIVRKSGGNPFFIEELINYLEGNVLDGVSNVPLDEIDLPNSMHSLVLSRIDQLTRDAQVSVKIASVIGRLFYASMLAGVHPNSIGMPKVEEDLRSIERHDLIEKEEGTAELAYFFKHIVIQEVAYDSLPHAFKSRIHEAAGFFLEDMAKRRRSNLLELLAYHFGRSDNTEKKRIYFRQAGDAARHSYSNEAAVDYYERLIPLSDDDEKTSLLIDLGSVLETTGDWGRARKHYDRALELARAAGDPGRIAHAESAIGELLRKRGDYAEAIKWLQRAAVGLEKAGDQVNLGQNLQSQGTLAAQTGNLADASRLYSDSLILRELTGDRRKAADLINNLGILERMKGNLETCEELYDQALHIRQELNDRWALANSYNNMGMLYRSRGEYGKASDVIEKSLQLNRAVGDRWATANSLNSLAEVALDAGDDTAASRALRESLLINRELGDKRALAFLLEAFAMLSARRSQSREAVVLAAAADQLRKDIKSPVSQADAKKLSDTLGPAYAALTGNELEAADQEGRALSLGKVLDRAMAAFGEPGDG